MGFPPALPTRPRRQPASPTHGSQCSLHLPGPPRLATTGPRALTPSFLLPPPPGCQRAPPPLRPLLLPPPPLAAPVDGRLHSGTRQCRLLFSSHSLPDSLMEQTLLAPLNPLKGDQDHSSSHPDHPPQHPVDVAQAVWQGPPHAGLRPSFCPTVMMPRGQNPRTPVTNTGPARTRHHLNKPTCQLGFSVCTLPRDARQGQAAPLLQPQGTQPPAERSRPLHHRSSLLPAKTGPQFPRRALHPPSHALTYCLV